jgi:hypothetical protein
VKNVAIQKRLNYYYLFNVSFFFCSFPGVVEILCCAAAAAAVAAVIVQYAIRVHQQQKLSNFFKLICW